MRVPFWPEEQALSRSHHKNPKPIARLKRSVLAATLCLSFSQLASAGVFINEIHYDNSGGDVGEAFEIAGNSGTDLSGWSVVFYNGSNSNTYRTTQLTGILANQQDGFGTLIFNLPSNGMQNGAPDGLALVDASNQVVQFLSYEGTMTAANGPAVGMTSTDIGVAESSSTPVGSSLQLTGTGSQASDFVWAPESANTYGNVNTNQTFGGGGPAVDLPPSITATTPASNTGVNALDANIDVSFSEGVSLSGNWYDINCSSSGNHSATLSGGPQHYSLNPDSDFTNNEVCTLTVVAALVSDLDSNDPPDNMDSDFSVSFATVVNSPIRINEVDADTSGSDKLEFLELYDGGIGNTPLDGLVVVLYNGSDSRSYNAAFDLDGFSTNAEGFFVLGNAAVLPTPDMIINNNSLQNGADAAAIHLGNAVDYPNDTPVSGLGLIDAVVYDTNDSDVQGLLNVLTPGQPQVNEDAAGDKDIHSNSRIPDGGQAIITTLYNAQLATPGASNVTEAEIFAIQGAGMTSPFEGSYVRTLDNVVTAIDSNGFFMQTPESRTDADENTSDGIFVFTGSAPSVAVGDMVDVEGRIVEFFNFTEFAGGSLVTVTSGGNSVPAVIEFNETTPSPFQPQPQNEIERFEGMIVSFHGIATAPTDRFGDTQVVTGNRRAYRESGIAYPGISGLPVWDGNPEIFEVDPDALGLANAVLFAGQKIEATGPLGFSFGDYQIWPTSIHIESPPHHLIDKVHSENEADMSVGFLNMFRLFDNIDDPLVDDPTISATEYATRLTKISRFILDVMAAPDILAVSEVESLSVLETLAAQIAAGDPDVQYTAYLQDGNDIGGIDVGFLVRRSIEVDQVTQYGKDAILDFDGSLLNDRPPLLLEGREISDGSNFPLKVLVVHNRSLSGVDNSRRGARVRAKRLAQAQFVANLVQDLQTENPDVNLIVTGDFNAYQFTDGYVDVVGQITGQSVQADNLLWEPSPVNPMLTNQVDELALDEQYSFIFGGSAQVLDHTLTSQNLDNLVMDFKFARGNSDVPSNLVSDATTPMRASDHDGVVLFLKKDSDNDSVTDDMDLCPVTSIPETPPTQGLKPNHFALVDGDSIFDSVNSNHSFTLADTAGCSCEQIAEKKGLGYGFQKHGCSKGVIQSWINYTNKGH